MWEKLHKFGLQYCDLSTMIRNVSCMLRFLTLNIDRRNNSRIPIILYLANLVMATSYLYVYCFSVYWFVFKRCRETGELLCGIVVFSLGVTSEIGVTKLICMFLYQDTVRDIVDGYLACDALVVPGSRFAVNLKKALRMVKKRALIFWVVIMRDGTSYITKALVTPGKHLMEDCFVFYGLEPIFESPNYEIAVIVNIISVIIVCYLPANISGFIIIVSGYTEAQLLTLSEELRQLWDDAQTHYIDNELDDDKEDFNKDNTIEFQEKIINEYIKHHLIDIVKFHTTNIKLIRQVEKVFHGAIATEFLLLIVGLIAILLGGLETTYIQLPFTLMLIGMDCIVGQRLMDASVVFENAVYDCKWERFDVSNRKIVLLVMQNAQKGMSLSAGGVATLSFTCFMSVIRMIYSAFTAIQSTM